jgi:SAM-dependent methyltransferase
MHKIFLRVAESYDAVIANHMLFHIPNRAKALSEIKRILKPGGKLYAATNGLNHLNEIYELIQTIDPTVYQERHPTEFGLENGQEQLSEYFSEINLYIYKDALLVTEIEPLIVYILSMQCSQVISDDQTELVSLIEQKIRSKGYIYITKSTGVFEAKK